MAHISDIEKFTKMVFIPIFTLQSHLLPTMALLALEYSCCVFFSVSGIVKKSKMEKVNMFPRCPVADNQDDSDAISWADNDDAENVPGKSQENMPKFMNGIFLAVIMEFSY